MDKDQQDVKKFLEEQLEWSKDQARILDKMNVKLLEMKRIAQYVVDHELSAIEMKSLNSQLNDLKNEFHVLEKQLHSVVH
ncbi:hypothetical protein JMM81_19965 [Bacillus sp. V3B]|uniref:hypothetical protein n=1 Tax=Bacillus sp. V3B TaxID=2804915 RepID=UPI002109AD40|nr:hypothetical protein [Bacillus sp. V3B]MCQ6277154.1 hypothetical protein [Bacillus sp. V3B]